MSTTTTVHTMAARRTDGIAATLCGLTAPAADVRIVKDPADLRGAWVTCPLCETAKVFAALEGSRHHVRAS